MPPTTPGPYKLRDDSVLVVVAPNAPRVPCGVEPDGIGVCTRECVVATFFNPADAAAYVQLANAAWVQCCMPGCTQRTPCTGPDGATPTPGWFIVDATVSSVPGDRSLLYLCPQHERARVEYLFAQRQHEDRRDQARRELVAAWDRDHPPPKPPWRS